MGKKTPARGGAQGKRRRAAPDPASESSEEDDALGNDGRPGALDLESSDEDVDPLEEAPAAGSGLLLQHHPKYIGPASKVCVSTTTPHHTNGAP